MSSEYSGKSTGGDVVAESGAFQQNTAQWFRVHYTILGNVQQSNSIGSDRLL